MLVAHSLGTVLSYMALANHPQWNVHTFVTLGSPLASPMVGDMLDPPLVDGKGQWPGSIERWVNVRAVGDKAAAMPLAERFGDRVEEVLVDNGHRAHAPEPYLNASVTGRAIAEALDATADNESKRRGAAWRHQPGQRPFRDELRRRRGACALWRVPLDSRPLPVRRRGRRRVRATCNCFAGVAGFAATTVRS